MAVQVFQPFEIFYDINGKPVDDGFIWVGQPNLDPETNQIGVFFDEALTIPATQPIRTRNGFPANAGVQAQIFVSETTFSITIKNKNSTVIRSVAEVHSSTDLEGRLRDTSSSSNGGAIVGFKLPLANAVSRNVSGVLFDSFSVLNWIPVAEHAAIRAGSSTFDCGPAIRAAIAAISVNAALYFPYGTYMVGKNAPGDSEAFNINKEGVTFFGEGTLKRKENNTGYFARLGADRTALVDLTLDGSRGATGIPDSSGFGATIRSAGFKKCEVRNCRIINSAGQGISAGAGCNEWMVSGNYLENFFSNAIQFAAEASDPEGFSFVRIEGNHIKGDLPSSSRFCNGIFLTSSATTTAQNTHFCDFNTVSGNFVEDVPDAGIESGYKCRYSVIEGNTIRRSFNANILVRDNTSPVISGNSIFCRSGHASTNRFGIYVDGLSISGDANPITNCFGVISSNSIVDAEQGGISIIASEYCTVANNNIQGVATNNGSSGINVKSGFSVVNENIIRNFQNLIRFSLEASRALGNQIKTVTCSNNIGDLGGLGIDLDATVAMELVDCDIYNNKFRALTTNTVGLTGTPTYTNTRIYNNIDGDTRQKNIGTQAAATAVVQSPSSIERNNASAQFGTVTAYDKFVAGIVSIRMGNEVALFKTEGDGTITAISESTNIGVVGSGKLYRLETLTGALVVKRYDVAQTYATFKASLI